MIHVIHHIQFRSESRPTASSNASGLQFPQKQINVSNPHATVNYEPITIYLQALSQSIVEEAKNTVA